MVVPPSTMLDLWPAVPLSGMGRNLHHLRDAAEGVTMTIEDALLILQGCDWLKITQRHVSASKWKSRAEMAFSSDPRSAHVSIRCKKDESFQALLIRAASLVKAGHVPTVRVPPLTDKDRCKCGAQSHDLVWNQQLQQRLCRKCEVAWMTAAKNNDMRPIETKSSLQ